MDKRLFIISFFITLFVGNLFAQTEELEKLRVIGENYTAESKYDSALFTFQRLDLEAKKAENVPYQAAAAMGLGRLYGTTKKADLAIESYKKANKLSKISNLPKYQNSSIFGVGTGFQIIWELDSTEIWAADSALYYYSLTRDGMIELEQKEEVAILLYNTALINTAQGDYLSAKDNLIKAVRFDTEIENSYGLSSELRQLGLVNYRLSLYDSAEYYYLKTLAITDSSNFVDKGLQVLNNLAVLYESQKNYEKAISYRKRYYDDSKNIFRLDYQDKLLELRQQYNMEELELRNELQENRILVQKRSQLLILIIGISLLVIISIWLYIVDQRRKTIKALAAKNDEINKQKIDELLQHQEIASLQGVLEGQETERKRVAIDLHDRLGGILSMVKLHFSAVEEKIDPENPTKEKFLTASELLDLAAGEVRNISHNMMSGVLAKFGLIPALEDLKTRISETGKLTVNLYTSNINGSLDGEQELQLYRIVQELMSNILKHSDATETNIQLNENEDSVNLIVEDDGIGFNPEKLDVNAGIGLSNLKARVAKLNGTLHIDSGLGSGTTVSIDIPIEDD
ncbi:sensor histidine kinase [Roseivirga sp. E12]|uniref:tetratricopeptide repeat-containing sensor histidine kinase n=1 Tax=Roseivirga sp. E12 TaxID=2819237 RepID=UPI001ABC9DF2|nr:sensor histidine kinase [Roseivirga sp. E12]MBO3698317.1 sensor histidine kinase [Roseivirga sp. E12]